MAIYNGRILVRKGNEADFDPDKMMPGEWALSTDKKIVRICVAAGMCIRMATYEAFEEDMKKVEAILLECQTIKEAVVRINAEVSQNADAVAEYTAQAKSYMESARTSAANAKTSENNSKTSEENAKTSETNAKVSEENAQAVFESLPEDYNTLSDEFYEVAIKQAVTGEQIHVDDSANAKVREFALFGKAKQNTTTGKNLIRYPYQQDSSGIATVLADGGIKISGTPTSALWFAILNNSSNVNPYYLPKGTYTISFESITTINPISAGVIDVADGSSIVSMNLSYSTYKETTFTVDKETNISIRLYSPANTAVDTIIYPMLRLADTDDTWEQPTNGATPRPDYPQEIKVAGASGSVEVKCVGKNLLKNTATSLSKDGVDFVVNSDGSVIANGTSTNNSIIIINDNIIDNLARGKSYKCIDITTCRIDYSNGTSTYMNQFTVEDTMTKVVPYIQVKNGNSVNKTYYPMIVEITETDDTWQPYKETISTIPTPNGLAGIKVSSGGNYTDSNGQQWICDEIVKYADGSGEYICRFGRLISRNSNGWFKIGGSQNQEDRFGIEVGAKMLQRVGISNYHNTVDNWGTSDNGIGFGAGESTTIYARFNGIETLEALNEKFNNIPFTVYYGLAEPITTPLTAEQLAEIEKVCTFYPVTNISNDADCGMKVTYLADSKNYIDNKLALQAKAREEEMMSMFLLLPEETQAKMIENDTNNLLTESEE